MWEGGEEEPVGTGGGVRYATAGGGGRSGGGGGKRLGRIGKGLNITGFARFGSGLNDADEREEEEDEEEVLLADNSRDVCVTGPCYCEESNCFPTEEFGSPAIRTDAGGGPAPTPPEDPDALVQEEVRADSIEEVLRQQGMAEDMIEETIQASIEEIAFELAGGIVGVVGNTAGAVLFARKQGAFQRGPSQIRSRPSSNFDAHHMFPQSRTRDFLAHGVDAWDPRYGAWWERTSHQQNARLYNDLWREFFDRFPRAGPDEVLQYGRELAERFCLEIHF